MDEIHEVDDQLEPEAPVVETVPRDGVPWGAIFLLIWAVALIVFSVQNAEDTTVEFLWMSWTMPVALLVMITSLATLILTSLTWSVYRRRRRKRRADARVAKSAD